MKAKGKLFLDVVMSNEMYHAIDWSAVKHAVDDTFRFGEKDESGNRNYKITITLSNDMAMELFRKLFPLKNPTVR